MKCAGCKKILVDTKTGEGNYIVHNDFRLYGSREFILEHIYIICTNCGRMVDLKKLEDLGISTEVFMNDFPR